MLVLGVVDQGQDQVDALTDGWGQFEQGVGIPLILGVVPLDLLDLLLHELIPHNSVPAHLRHQEHDLLHLVAHILLLVLEIHVDFCVHLFLEDLCPALGLFYLGDLLVFEVQARGEMLDAGGELVDLGEQLGRETGGVGGVVGGGLAGEGLDGVNPVLDAINSVLYVLFHLGSHLLDRGLESRHVLVNVHVEFVQLGRHLLHRGRVHLITVLLLLHQLTSPRRDLILHFHLHKINLLRKEILRLLRGVFELGEFLL